MVVLDTVDFVVLEPQPLVIEGTMFIRSPIPTENNGSINLLPAEVTPPYSFVWKGPAGSFTSPYEDIVDLM